jgi:hypothetical protein
MIPTPPLFPDHGPDPVLWVATQVQRLLDEF